MAQATITIKLKSSPIGCPEKHKLICRSLGLKKINQTATVPDNKGFRGMVAKVPHLLAIVSE
jgi:large subunit ribosomal protein L30